MPEPTDRIILTPGPDGWSHRYTVPPSGEDGYDLFGFTNCCKRMIGVPRGEWPQPESAARSLLKVTDCCDRPFAIWGPKPVELPPYSGEHATCRKCESKAVETKFTTRGGDSVGRYGIPRAGYPQEWLARRCAVCQATWDEATVDVERGDAEPETPSARHARDHHGEPNIMQLGCPGCAQELAESFEMSLDVVLRSMANVRASWNADG